jgi:hypothetical protein
MNNFNGYGVLAAALLVLPLRGQDPLEQLNAAFRESYVQAKADCLARGGPVLMVTGERLLLFRPGAKTAEEPLRPGLYHRFKEVAHVPLALYLLLSGPGTARSLAPLRALAAAARAGLKDWCPPADLPRQETILDACLGIMDAAAGPGGVPPARLAAFTGAMGPLVLANADRAASLELELLDRSVARFRAALGPAGFQALRVVIVGAHMARAGEVSLQYFLRLLGEAEEGGRVIYAESLWQPHDAMELLATHRVDQGAGAAFFGEPRRMHRDLLADGARKWLDNHPLTH